MLAKRWSGPEALSAGIVQQICPADALLDEAVAEVQRMAKRLTRNRKAFAWRKEHIYGEHAAIQGSHGPAYMLRNPGEFAFGPGSPPANPKL
jgi:enoyl-CoA hydratase/carnithine racemase